MADEQNLSDIDTNGKDFRAGLAFYRIYRNMSAILLAIYELYIGKKPPGRGWRLFYQYSRQQDEEDE
jgi:hypothetical protein